MEFVREYVTLQDVLDAYISCRKHKSSKLSCVEFEMNEQENLIRLWEELNNGTYKIGYSDVFVVSRPKYREVFAADFRDRIVHHLIINKTNELFESYFIDDTYNCRKGKGTLFGIERIHEQIRVISEEYTKDCFLLKWDLKGFFMSIDKRILWPMLKKFLIENYKGDDLEWLLWIVEMVVMHRPELKCKRKCGRRCWDHIEKSKSLFWVGKWLGMAIGNLTSQIFANFFLTLLDRFVKNHPGIGYGRYVDDFIIICSDKAVLLELMEEIRKFLKEQLAVTVHPDKWYIQHYSKGVNMIGATIKRERLYSGNRSVHNAFEFVRKVEFDGDIERYVQRYNSFTGTMSHYRTYNIRKRLFFALPEPVVSQVIPKDDLTSISIKPEFKPKNQLLEILKNDKYGKTYFDFRNIRPTKRRWGWQILLSCVTTME